MFATHQYSDLRFWGVLDGTKMNYFDGLYTLIEIAINNNIPQDDIAKLTRFINNKQDLKILF